MNKKLPSILKSIRFFKHSYAGNIVKSTQDLFSDLVPFSVTVGGVSNPILQSIYSFNPMTANNCFYNAVVSHDVETFNHANGLDTLGAALRCTTPVIFKKS